MPLHLLGKKSWNVYNADNIARVKADEAEAAAREAADEQRMQELDAARRAAILRGRTPPPLPEETKSNDTGRRQPRNKDDRGHDRKRRKLAGEDDTDMDIRLARVATGHNNEDWEDAKILKLRSTAHDAPLTDHAGNIDLFPVDMKDAIKHEKNAEVEKEKRKKEQSFEDQYTMRFSNAAGREGLSKPWYATEHDPVSKSQQDNELMAYSGFESKDVWGNEEPRRREREQARIISNDPFAFMQKAQTQLKKSKEDKKKWAAERDRELRGLRAAQEREGRKSRHRKRKRRDEEDDKTHRSDRHTREVSSKHRHYRRSRSRSHSRDRHAHKSSRHQKGSYDSKSRDRHRDDRTKHESHRRRDDGEILVEGHGVS